MAFITCIRREVPSLVGANLTIEFYEIAFVVVAISEFLDVSYFFVVTRSNYTCVYGNSKVYHLVIEKCTTFQSGAKLHLI
jgi:hypothetical protein